ncbi:MAG: DNA polymerase III subunit delta [Bacteroidales bacterium]
MAKQADNTVLQFNTILSNIKNKIFKSVYILMGEEPYYSDIIIEQLIENVLQPHERDFNQIITYASSTNAAEIVSMARRFPMFAARQLVIIKEAQLLSKLEALEKYLGAPAPETILVLAFTNKSADKRTSFYKKAKDVAEVFESTAVRDWDIPKWITNYLKERNIKIEGDAANLMMEHTGNSLRKIVLEIDKLIKGIPQGCNIITVKDIEINIGISREYSAFEMCKLIAFKDYDKAFKIAIYLGENSKKYPLVLTLGAMFFYFSKLLKCHAYFAQDGGVPDNAARKAGAYNSSQINEYVQAMKNYSLNKTMGIIALIKEYDYKSKSSLGGQASDGELLTELVSKMFH